MLAAPPNATTCARCQKWWGGLNTGHCTGCHQTFTGITAFDRHRTGSHARDTRTCLDPAEVGLVESDRAYPCWANPGNWTGPGSDDD